MQVCRQCEWLRSVLPPRPGAANDDDEEDDDCYLHPNLSPIRELVVCAKHSSISPVWAAILQQGVLHAGLLVSRPGSPCWWFRFPIRHGVMSPPTRGDREFQVEGRTYGPLDQCGPVYHNTTLVSLVAPNMHCPGSRGIFVDRTLKWGTQTHLGSAGVNFYAGGDAGAWTFDPKERLDDLDRAWVALELRVTAAKTLKGGSSGRYCINAEASRMGNSYSQIMSMLVPVANVPPPLMLR